MEFGTEDFWYGMEENCQYGIWKNRLPFHSTPCPVDKTGQTQQKRKDVVAASYEIDLFVAELKQPHTIAESLILPGAKILVKRVFGDQAVAKLNAVFCFSFG